MDDKDIALELLREHFRNVTPTDFRARLRRTSPELGNLPAPQVSRGLEETLTTQVKLFEPMQVELHLDGYLASALTGLTQEQRQLVFQLSDVISVVCKRFNISVYEPRKKTDPVYNSEIKDSEVFWLDRTQVLKSDLLILLCHYPSFGAGEELDFAYNALVPTLLISHSDNPVSRMVTGIPGMKISIEYSEPENLRVELERRLQEVRPVLEERKMAFSSYDANIVGERIRMRREALNLTREQVGSSGARHLKAEMIQRLEESTDKIGNPSLLQLRELATVLKTTVSDLVEPDMGSQVIARLDEWIRDQVAARSGEQTHSRRDRNRMIRRVLYRIADSLEQDDAFQD